MKSAILKEFRHHGPFTLLGALLGVGVVFLLQHFAPNALNTKQATSLFEFTHPMHVVLSAMVTAAMYKNYRGRPHHTKSGMLAIVLVGYFGSIGIATVSDCLVPYWAELTMGMKDAHPHIGIVEMPVIINLAALLGIGGAFVSSQTHFSHGGHVLLSTAASLFHMVRAHGTAFGLGESLLVVGFLFLAVWVPCCLSDIVFPLLFVRKKSQLFSQH